ncbi:MAG TPA: hypothetical protein VFX47_00640, partial [Gammaproteobacteria bacterium]|nr:hypothetical protein [Gammaproteobacteria bacterium]
MLRLALLTPPLELALPTPSFGKGGRGWIFISQIPLHPPFPKGEFSLRLRAHEKGPCGPFSVSDNALNHAPLSVLLAAPVLSAGVLDCGMV